MTRGQEYQTTASDNFQLGGYRADPAAAPQAQIVVIQEIFGAIHPISRGLHRLASEGIRHSAAIFDRVEPNFTSGYSPTRSRSRANSSQSDWAAIARLPAAIDAVKNVGRRHIASARAALPYAAATKRQDYPRRSAITAAPSSFAETSRKYRPQLHFGGKGRGITLTDVETIRQAT